MSVVKLTGNYGYTAYTVYGLEAGSLIDAVGASWILSNSANQNPDVTISYLDGSGQINKYPFSVYNAGYGLTIKGGAIWGEVPQSSDWAYTYNNSAAIRVEDSPGAIIDEWRIDKAWDGIRFRGNSAKFLIDDTYVSNVRDDAIENDFGSSGTVRDSLFDGVFVGMGLVNVANPDASANTITFDHVNMRMKNYLYNGDMTHGSFFKTNTDAPATTPDIRIIDSVLAIEDVTPIHVARLKLAWDNLVESHGNVLLNLTDTPLPSSYPKPPAGFTILQGQMARDYWAATKAAWIDNHDGTPVSDVTALPSLPGAALAPAPVDITVIGLEVNESIFGTGGKDYVNGLGGDDFLYGKAGADILAGGWGRDKFVFDTTLDGSVDRITDFNAYDDRIYLENAIFTKVGSGSWSTPKVLNSSYIEARPGALADDANDYILYDTSSGILSYDADGNGPIAPIAFAQLSSGLSLSNLDFYVI